MGYVWPYFASIMKMGDPYFIPWPPCMLPFARHPHPACVSLQRIDFLCLHFEDDAKILQSCTVFVSTTNRNSRTHLNHNKKRERDVPSARLTRLYGQLDKTGNSPLLSEQPSVLCVYKKRLQVAGLEDQAFSREDLLEMDAEDYNDPFFTDSAKPHIMLMTVIWLCDPCEISEETVKLLFESTKLYKSELNKTRLERRHLVRKYLQQQKQKRALLHKYVEPGTVLLAFLSGKLLLTRASSIRDYRERVRNYLNSLECKIGKKEDTPEEMILECVVFEEKEDEQIIQEKQKNGEYVISIDHMRSEHAPDTESDRSQCYVDSVSCVHNADVTDSYTGCFDSHVRYLVPGGTGIVCGIYCKGEGSGRVEDGPGSSEEGSGVVEKKTAGGRASTAVNESRCEANGRVEDGLGSSEEGSGMIEKKTADGSASTAVNESRCDEIKEALPFSICDKLENVGSNENASVRQPSNKASTVPVVKELLAEKKELLALSRNMENEENKTCLKKSSNGKTIEQNENQTYKKADDDQILERHLRFWVNSPRRQYVVNMLKSSQVKQVMQQGFESEMRRLATFVNFQPPSGVYVIRLANAGFFLPINNPENTGALNVLQMVLECAFCGVLVEVLNFQSRQPMEVHREASPSCPLVLGQDGRNVSIAQMAQTTGAHFLDTYPSPTAGASPYGGVRSRSNGEEYAIDGDGSTTSSAFPQPDGVGSKDNAAAKPAFMASVPAQTAIVGFAAVGQGQTVADARGLPSTQLLPFTGPALPRQTATFVPSADCTSSQPSSVTPGNATSPAGTTQPSSPSREVENSGEGTGSSTQERQVVTYEQLGIFAQRPRRPDMAVVATRMTTFEGWPHAGSHPASEMADAGFYYTGQADLVRCFYCRGGLRTWERSDHPWVEHGRWFPRCPFVRLCRGQKFVDAIQQLNENGASKISEEDVKREIIRKEEEAKRNRPVAVMPASSPPPSSGKTDEDRGAVGGATTSIRADYTVGDGNDVAALSRRLQEENQELKETTLCKMCQQREVNVLFLPCGHLVACAHCAPALRVCAICRQQVKGSVRVLLDEEEDVTADQ